MLLILAIACGDRRVDLDDDSARIRLFRPSPNDEVASPYVLGGHVDFRLGSDTLFGDPDRWTLQADPDAVALTDEGGGAYEAVFLREGWVDLDVLDADGELLDRVEVEVLAPDRIELVPRGPVKVGVAAEPVEELTVLAGQISAWEVFYEREGRVLYGNEALAVAGAEFSLEDYAHGSERDTLLLTAPEEPGAYSLELGVADGGGFPVPLEVVAAEDIDALELLLPDEEGAEEGEQLHVLVRAWVGGVEVHGVPGEWSVERQSDVEGTGDLFTYDYDRRIEQRLVVRLGEQQAVGTIHGLGSVGSTTTCAPAGLPASLLLGLAGLVGLRRRVRGSVGPGPSSPRRSA